MVRDVRWWSKRRLLRYYLFLREKRSPDTYDYISNAYYVWSDGDIVNVYNGGPGIGHSYGREDRRTRIGTVVFILSTLPVTSTTTTASTTMSTIPTAFSPDISVIFGEGFARVLSKSGSIGIGDFIDAGANAKNITLSYGKTYKDRRTRLIPAMRVT